MRIMEVFADKEFIPGVISEVAAGGSSSQRLQLATADRLVSMTIMSERIDIQFVSDKKNGFDSHEAAQLCSLAAEYMGKLYSAFEEVIQDSYRLAWDVNYAFFEITEAERMDFRNRFLKEIPFYRDNSTDEFVAQYVGREERNINEKAEQINVLTTITRWFPGSGAGNVASVDGYKVEFDINTHHECRKNRFSGEAFRQFIEVAVEIQRELEENFFYGYK